LRDVLAQLPEDPWLLISEKVNSTATERRGRLEPAEQIVQQVTRDAQTNDLVGFYAAGTIYRGFANSYGQRNWHEVDTFNFDWSLYLREDKAVKSGYADFDWDAQVFDARLETSVEQLERLKIPAITLEPGEYRAYLTPRALEEVTGLLQLDAF